MRRTPNNTTSCQSQTLCQEMLPVLIVRLKSSKAYQPQVLTRSETDIMKVAVGKTRLISLLSTIKMRGLKIKKLTISRSISRIDLIDPRLRSIMPYSDLLTHLHWSKRRKREMLNSTIRHWMPHQVKGSISASRTKAMLEDPLLRWPETTERGRLNNKIKTTQTSRPSSTRRSHLIVPVSSQIVKVSIAEDPSVPTWSINITTSTLMSQRKKRLKFRLLTK